MKDKTKNTPQVLLRRALLVLLDAAIVAFSFYFALLLRADGAVEAGGGPTTVPCCTKTCRGSWRCISSAFWQAGYTRCCGSTPASGI